MLLAKANEVKNFPLLDLKDPWTEQTEQNVDDSLKTPFIFLEFSKIKRIAVSSGSYFP